MLKIANDRYVSIAGVECKLGVMYFKQHASSPVWLILGRLFVCCCFLGGGGGGGGVIVQYPWRSLEMYI